MMPGSFVGRELKFLSQDKNRTLGDVSFPEPSSETNLVARIFHWWPFRRAVNMSVLMV